MRFFTGIALVMCQLACGQDFNGDGVLDCQDIDALTSAAVGNPGNDQFDLDGNGTVDREDVNSWLVLAGNATIGTPYRHGDANLDGAVNVTDFVTWNSNKLTLDTDWCHGNFFVDPVIDMLDFAVWRAGGNYIPPQMLPHASDIFQMYYQKHSQQLMIRSRGELSVLVVNGPRPDEFSFPLQAVDYFAHRQEWIANPGETPFTGKIEVAEFPQDTLLEDFGRALAFVDGQIFVASVADILPGDANLDRRVDGEDFIIWNFNKFKQNREWTTGDFTADERTDGEDFIEWNRFKFQVLPEPTLVPEPALSWLLFVTLCLGTRRYAGF